MTVTDPRTGFRLDESSNGMFLSPEGFQLPLSRLLKVADRWRDLDDAGDRPRRDEGDGV